MPSPNSLSFGFSAKDTSPSKLFFNSSKKYVLKFMRQVAPQSRNEAFFYESIKELNKSSIAPLLQCATT